MTVDLEKMPRWSLCTMSGLVELGMLAGLVVVGERVVSELNITSLCLYKRLADITYPVERVETKKEAPVMGASFLARTRPWDSLNLQVRTGRKKSM